MMNDKDELKKSTKAFGFIGEYAGVSRLSAVLNRMFKENSKDAMIIPMNIREDDLFFTISNMKQSKLDGAVISNEYVAQVVEILDDAPSMVKRSGMCDIIFKKDERLRGDIFSTRVLTEYLKDIAASKIAIIGINHHAKAFSFLACGFEVSYFNENLEQLMEFTTEVELHNADLNRVADDMPIDFSLFDVVLDFSDMESLSMITSLAKFNFDMKNSKEFSALKQRAGEIDANYTSYDDIVEKFCDRAYTAIIK
ncbi:MAG: hypothetical protein U9P38_07525 [Campylobacterota bacterium]|nr:hypothetical protein [Campylobacterota bacterium]